MTRVCRRVAALARAADEAGEMAAVAVGAGGVAARLFGGRRDL